MLTAAVSTISAKQRGWGERNKQLKIEPTERESPKLVDSRPKYSETKEAAQALLRSEVGGRSSEVGGLPGVSDAGWKPAPFGLLISEL